MGHFRALPQFWCRDTNEKRSKYTCFSNLISPETKHRIDSGTLSKELHLENHDVHRRIHVPRLYPVDWGRLATCLVLMCLDLPALNCPDYSVLAYQERLVLAFRACLETGGSGQTSA
jgi:hypothetical protein